MEIKQEGNIVETFGVIKSMSEATKLNDILDTYQEGSSVIIKLHDTFIIPSMLIGGLLKKVGEGIKIELQVYSDILYEVLDDLSLIDKLHVTKINL